MSGEESDIFHELSRVFPPMTEEEFAGLKESIREQGLSEPLLTYRGKVVDGRHRYLACKQLGIEPRFREWEGSYEELVASVIARNVTRRHLTRSQRAAIAAETLGKERELARARQGERRDLEEKLVAITKSLEDFRAVVQRGGDQEKPAGGRAAERAARRFSVGSRNVSEAFRVKREAPEVFKRVKEGKLNIAEAKRLVQLEEGERQRALGLLERGEHRKVMEVVRRVRQERLQRGESPLPAGTYDVILADPPWSFSEGGHAQGVYPNRYARNHYPPMGLEEIKGLGEKLPVAEDAVLFLWVPATLLKHGLEVVEAWGFTYKSNLVTVKDKLGMGNYFRIRHEFLLLGVKGRIGVPLPGSRQDSVLEVRRGKHSEKPEEVYEMIERMYPGKTYLELFARKKRENWQAWGNEIDPGK